MMNLKSFTKNLSPLAYSFFHLGLLVIVYNLLVLGSFIHTFDIYHFLQWDAYWYAGIAKEGYQFSEFKPSNTAFFPMFPFVWKVLWKLSNAGVGQICLFNTILFLGSMTILKKTYNFSWMYFLVFVSLPSNIFMYVPYTESLFFFFSTILLAGFKLDSNKLIITGLFFASLTRPSATFFIPAILIMELMNYTNLKHFIKRVILFLVPIVIAFLLVLLIQYIQTGIWLAFFKDGWSRQINFPQFPLTTWGGLKNLWLDGLAFFFGILSLFILIIYFIKKLKGKTDSMPSNAEAFSLTYILMALFTLLFFGGVDKDGGTTLLSLNRFLFATPYFTIFLFYVAHKYKFDKKQVVIYVGISLLSLLFLNLNGTGYNEFKLDQKVFYGILMICNCLLYLLISKRFQSKFLAMVYLVNLCIQVILLSQFANAKWVG